MTFSTDLLWRAVFLWYYDDLPVFKIAETLRISESTVKRVLRRFRTNQPLVPETRWKKRSDKKMGAAELLALANLVQENATLYLDELRDAIHRRTGTRLSLPTVCRALVHELHITRKMLHKRSAEACGQILCCWGGGGRAGAMVSRALARAIRCLLFFCRRARLSFSPLDFWSRKKSTQNFYSESYGQNGSNLNY